MRKLGVVMAAGLVAAASALAQQQVSEKRPASRDGLVEVHNVSGSVKVLGWDRDEVEVTGTLGRGTDRLEFTGSGSTTRIKVVLPQHSHNVDGSDLEVHVPAGSRVEVNTVSATIDADKVTGPLRLESVSGGIAAAGNPREVEAKTVSGEVSVSAVAAPVRARSVSGELTLTGLTGRVDASSVSGKVVVKGTRFTEAELETTSGDIRFDGDLAKDASLRAKSMSGTVELALPADAAADYEVSTFSGSIANELGPEAKRTSEYGPGRELSFSTGGGGARVAVSSFSGSVRLRKR